MQYSKGSEIMEIIMNIVQFFQTNWVELAAGLWLIEQALRVLSKITPWTWDDNLVDVLAKILGQVFPKKPSA